MKNAFIAISFVCGIATGFVGSFAYVELKDSVGQESTMDHYAVANVEKMTFLQRIEVFPRPGFDIRVDTNGYVTSLHSFYETNDVRIMHGPRFELSEGRILEKHYLHGIELHQLRSEAHSSHGFISVLQTVAVPE